MSVVLQALGRSRSSKFCREGVADQTKLRCLSSVSTHSPDSMLHKFAVPSSESLNTSALSGENAADVTRVSCPPRLQKRSADCTFHNTQGPKDSEVGPPAPDDPNTQGP